MKKIPPSERIRKEIRELLTEGTDGGGLLSAVVQKGMQLIMQEMLEAESEEFLGRSYYQRNGVSRLTLK